MVTPDSCLEKLESLVDPDHVAAADQLQRAAWDRRPIPRLPCLINLFDKTSKERRGHTDWPVFSFGEVFRDPEKMLLDELGDIYVGALLRDDKMYTIRANYGIGLIPSLFGCKVKLVDDREMPWVEPLGIEGARRAIANGVPDLNGGLVERVEATQQHFLSRLSPYPRLSQTVHVYLPDMQGPFNLAAEIVGPEVYLLLYDDPAFAHELLAVATETFIAVGRREKAFLKQPMDDAYYWGYHVRGGVRLSEDYALSLSPVQYDEFVRPYNERALAAFGGGFVLYADNTPHILDHLLDTRGLLGISVHSDRAEDLPMICAKAGARGMGVMWCGPCLDRYLDEIQTGVIVDYVASSLEDGLRLLARLR